MCGQTSQNLDYSPFAGATILNSSIATNSPKLENRTDHYSLKKLAANLLGDSVQERKHSAIEDAKATMKLYLLGKQIFTCGTT